jgi:hypothetical protein
VRDRVNRTLQLRHQIGDRAFQVVRNMAYGSAIVRLRLKPDRLEQQRGGDMARMGNEWDGHPRAYRLSCQMDLPCMRAGLVGEDESACNREQEGETKNQHAPPRFPHHLNIAPDGRLLRTYVNIVCMLFESDKVMFEIYRETGYTGQFRVVYFTELQDHNKETEINHAMAGEHFFDGFIKNFGKDEAKEIIDGLLSRLNNGERFEPAEIERVLGQHLA